MTGPYLIDSSAWIEYLRKTDSPADHAVDKLIKAQPLQVLMTEPIRFELLAGAPDAHAYLQLQAVLGRFPQTPVDAATDWDSAVVVFRSVRERGKPVRSLLDCLIAAVAIRTGATLVHRDADFTAIADVMPSLKIRSLL